VATLELDNRATSCEIGEDRLHGGTILRMDVLHERLRQQLAQGVPQASWERRIGALQAPVEPRDEKCIPRKLEQPHQLVVKRQASRSHDNLVSSAHLSGERPDEQSQHIPRGFGDPFWAGHPRVLGRHGMLSAKDGALRQTCLRGSVGPGIGAAAWPSKQTTAVGRGEQTAGGTDPIVRTYFTWSAGGMSSPVVVTAVADL
jgi:hypothetical protein